LFCDGNPPSSGDKDDLVEVTIPLVLFSSTETQILLYLLVASLHRVSSWVIDVCGPRTGFPTLAETQPTLASELKCVVREDPLREPPSQDFLSKRGTIKRQVVLGLLIVREFGVGMYVLLDVEAES
jgi:hypothetical protein